MVFWKRYIDKVKTAISKVDFLKLEKKVKQNESDIAINKELINQAEENINTLTETVNTNSSDIGIIKNKYAKKDETNSWTASQNFDAGGNFREDLNVFNDKKFKLGYTPKDIKIEISGVSGNSNARIKATKANLELTAEGSVVINKVPTPTANDNVANKKYVDDKVAGVPQPDLTPYLTKADAGTTYLTKADAGTNYLSKTEAQADYGRLARGLENDWYSTNNFRTTPQSFGGVNYSKDLATKEYVDAKLSGSVIKSRILNFSQLSRQFYVQYGAEWVLRFNFNLLGEYGISREKIINLSFSSNTEYKDTVYSYLCYDNGWIDLTFRVYRSPSTGEPPELGGHFYLWYID